MTGVAEKETMNVEREDEATTGMPSVTDPLNHITSFEYDPLGNLISTTDPVGNRTQRTYDAVSRLIALTDPRGKSTAFTYDHVNQVTQLTEKKRGQATFQGFCGVAHALAASIQEQVQGGESWSRESRVIVEVAIRTDR